MSKTRIAVVALLAAALFALAGPSVAAGGLEIEGWTWDCRGTE